MFLIIMRYLRCVQVRLTDRSQLVVSSGLQSMQDSTGSVHEAFILPAAANLAARRGEMYSCYRILD